MGYRLLALRLLGAHVVMRYHGRTVMSDIHVEARSLVRSGEMRVGGASYLTATIATGRFPSGTLHITLLFRAPAASLALESCAQVGAHVLAGFVHRVYGEMSQGPAAAIARNVVRRSKVLPAAVAGGRRKRTLASARRLLRAGHLVRLRVVSRRGAVLADLGTTLPVLDPITVTLRRHGRAVGHAKLAIESADSFVGVASYLVGADVLVRAGARQLVGRVAGPATLPLSGQVTWNGAQYTVASFGGTRFPSGPVVVYVMVKDSGQAPA
jgi:hypothetical protein